MAFTLAIIGRPNTGKSTLFNRLTGRKLALVDDRPGVTRDRREGDAKLGDLHFKVIDTAGLERAKDGTLEARMHAQTQAAMQTADMILLLTDARAGILPEDKHFAALIRKRPQKIILAANKYESQAGEAGYLEAYELGLGEPIALSAEHGHGMGAL
ncbi:MAG: 50S ribosome-binding GTPase, partial [Alphaproteobacteria bacterium]|nr:50S ribosome-binding GTPase [Alphaproteobacteria bacterium]